MANTISPFGAQDLTHFGGSQRTEELARVWIQSSDVTPVFHGDLVVGATPVSSTLLTGGYGQYVTQGSSLTTGFWRGVFRGCKFYNPTIQRMQFSKYWPGAGVAGTSSNTGDIEAYIVTDPNQRFIIQASSVGIIGSSAIGSGAFVAVNGATGTPSSAGGNTITGLSGVQLASSTLVAASSAAQSIAPFRIVDFYSNVAPGLLPGQAPGSGTGAFVNGADNTTVGQYILVEPYAWDNRNV